MLALQQNTSGQHPDDWAQRMTELQQSAAVAEATGPAMLQLTKLEGPKKPIVDPSQSLGKSTNSLDSPP